MYLKSVSSLLLTITAGFLAPIFIGWLAFGTFTDYLPLLEQPTMTRTPVYFMSHGGPNIMEQTEHPAFATLQSIGKEITNQVKPKAVVVFSAHWQASRHTIEFNMAKTIDLIYDMYGFPQHYYEMQYPNEGSPELAVRVLDLLKSAGIEAKGVHRGLDHGVWAPFTVAFNPESNALGVPLVQVSLFASDDPDVHFRLGQAIFGLRDEGVQIIVSGMAVHNLRDMQVASKSPGALPYVTSFDEALREAVEAPVDERQGAMRSLLERPDARKAHPSFDHLLPLYVGAGAAGTDRGRRLWTLAEGSFSWAQFGWGC